MLANKMLSHLCRSHFSSGAVFNILTRRQPFLVGGVRDMHFQQWACGQNMDLSKYQINRSLFEIPMFAKGRQAPRMWLSSGATQEKVQVANESDDAAQAEMAAAEEFASLDNLESDAESETETYPSDTSSSYQSVTSVDDDTSFEDDDEEYKDMKGSVDERDDEDADEDDDEEDSVKAEPKAEAKPEAKAS